MRFTSTLLAGVAMLAALPASATLMVSGSVGGVTVLHCEDNQATSALCPGGDQNLATGTLQLQNNTFLGIAINGSVQSSTGTPGNPGPFDILNTSNLNITNTTGVTASIEAAVGDVDFAGPARAFNLSNSGTWQLADKSTITTDFWDDPLNAQGGLTPSSTPGTQIDAFSSTAVGAADAYSNATTGIFINPGAFSMTQHFKLDLVGDGQLVNSGRTQLVAPVDEPGTLALLGIALLGLGMLRSTTGRRISGGPIA